MINVIRYTGCTVISSISSSVSAVSVVSRRLRDLFSAVKNGQTPDSPTGSLLLELPSDVVERMLQFRGCTTPYDHEYLEARNQAAITDLWNSVLPALISDPIVASYIHQLKFERPINRETLDPKEPPGSERFEQLYQKMCDGLLSIPESVQAVSRCSRQCYLLLAQELRDISLKRAWGDIRTALGNAATLPPEHASPADIRAWLTDPVNGPTLKTVTTLDLSGNHLLVVPPEIKHFSNITFLDLRNNDIKTLSSDQFSGLERKLTAIDLSHNRISTIINTTGWYGFFSLQWISLNDNGIAREDADAIRASLHPRVKLRCDDGFWY